MSEPPGASGGLSEPPGASSDLAEPPGATSDSVQAPPGSGEDEPLQAMGGDDAPATPTQEPVPSEFYTGFAVTCVFVLGLLLWYYKGFDAEQFEILDMLVRSVMPLTVLTLVVLGVILFGITTATESAAVGAAGAFVIFILGWPLEWTEIIVIFLPIFLPLLQHFQIDPILWGVLVFVNLQAAFLSPPVAMSAFYLKGVSPPHVTINQIFAGMMPYMLIVVLCMVLMYIWPGLTLWLPTYLYGK